MFALTAHGHRNPKRPGRGFSVGRRHSRVKGYPEVRGEFPVVTLADEIESRVKEILGIISGGPAAEGNGTGPEED